MILVLPARRFWKKRARKGQNGKENKIL